MNKKNNPWRLHILLGTIVTGLWGLWSDFSNWQWIAGLGASILASFAGALVFRLHYLMPKRVRV
ncbi:hypothetical protein A1353_19055 [Methylomonas methanica]|uniref:Uncharacterized protein n=1 Tax=Methylomonas methanica TaxID=421 RepID=A0A177M7Z9_METMH|nr:hypothetical protein [Methylomonas methanica]OAI00909.1 hypothetical protein A1353_19055 [Methylomonas methanica]